MTLADRVRALEQAHGAHWTRTPQPDGTVMVRLEFEDGDAITGRGVNTAEAHDRLETNVSRFVGATT